MIGDALVARLWLGRLVVLGVAAAILFIALVPLGFTPRFLPRPDILLCLSFAVALRRPEFLPVWLLAAIFLLADILLLRPPGLWTAIVILAIEFARNQEYRFREAVFPFEWLFVAGIMFLAMLANRLVLTMVFLPVPGFGSEMLYFVVTALVYPIVVAFVSVVLRIRKISPDEAVLLGHRL